MQNNISCSGFLLDLWREQSRALVLPKELQPADKAAAYAVQSFITRESKQPLYGWKIAATSVAGQKHIGVDGPLAGRYIAERSVKSGATVRFGRNHMKVAEVEFAFRMGRSLAPRATAYTESEVFDAVSSMHPSIEIPDSRYDKFESVGANALIADNACADWLCIGDAAPDKWRNMDLAAYKPIGHVKGQSAVQGLGCNVLGSPRKAMTWLVNELSSLGITLAAGQIVTTGTCLIPMKIKAGDHIEADFGELGKVTLNMGA